MSLTITAPSIHSRQQVIDFLKAYQDRLTDAIMALDQSAVLQEDAWIKIPHRVSYSSFETVRAIS